MIDGREPSERDAATDRAASAARALATVADNAAREYVKRDAVPPQPDGRDTDMVPRFYRLFREPFPPLIVSPVDNAERERQDRLRRWQTPPNPTRRDA